MEQGTNRREKKKQHVREKIFTAAVSLFAQNGFKETSIAEIMKEADLGTGTFYNYFESKEELLGQFFRDKITGAKEAMESILVQEISPSQKLLAAIKVMGETFEANPYLIQFINSLLRMDSRLRPPGNHGAMFRDVLIKIIQEGQASQEFNPDISPKIIIELIHGIIFPALTTSSSGERLTDKLLCKMAILFEGIKSKGENKDAAEN